MKKVIIIFFFLINSASASEITGMLSTKVNDSTYESSGKSNNKQSNMLFKQVYNNGEKKDISDKVISVLGINNFYENKLVRADNEKIYQIKGIYKIYIKNLNELKTFAGEEIYYIEKDVLIKYESKNYHKGNLLRKKGETAVYEIQDNNLYHITSLSELKKYYFGQEIYNISSIEFSLYLNQ